MCLVVVENLPQLSKIFLEGERTLKRIWSQFGAFLLQSNLLLSLLLQDPSELALFLLGLLKSRSNSLLIASQLQQALLQVLVPHRLLSYLRLHRLAIVSHIFQAPLILLVLPVQGLYPSLGGLGLVVMLIDDSGLRLSEPDKVDQVAEDLNEPLICRLVEVVEAEIGDSTFEEQPAQRHVEAHQVARIGGNDVGELAADILGRRAHRRLDAVAGGIEKQLGKPLKNLLNVHRVGLLEVCHGEVDADICDAADNLAVGEAHEGVGVFLLLPRARLLLLRDDAHSRIVRHFGYDFVVGESMNSMFGVMRQSYLGVSRCLVFMRRHEIGRCCGNNRT